MPEVRERPRLFLLLISGTMNSVQEVERVAYERRLALRMRVRPELAAPLAHDEAIARCRRAYRTEGARWPVPLIAFLDEPPGERRVFDWLTSCVGDLLDHLGQ